VHPGTVEVVEVGAVVVAPDGAVVLVVALDGGVADGVGDEHPAAVAVPTSTRDVTIHRADSPARGWIKS
jgi:hypothetical protein